MDSVRAHVADGRGHRPRDFALDAYVPVQGKVRFRVLVGGIGLETSGAESDAAKPRESPRRQIAGTDGLREREGSRLLNVVFPRTGKHVEDPKAASNGGFPVVERVPCKTDPRLDILKCGVCPIEARDSRWETTENVRYNREPVLRLLRESTRLISEA